jgi:hypothetical protein
VTGDSMSRRRQSQNGLSVLPLRCETSLQGQKSSLVQDVVLTLPSRCSHSLGGLVVPEATSTSPMMQGGGQSGRNRGVHDVGKTELQASRRVRLRPPTADYRCIEHAPPPVLVHRQECLSVVVDMSWAAELWIVAGTATSFQIPV